MTTPLERITIASPCHGETGWRFIARGPLGAVEFHLRSTDPDDPIDGAMSRPGFETHSLVEAGVAHHPNCRVLDGRPCLHDGSGLWAADYWLPRFEASGVYWLWPRLEEEYRKRFEGEPA